MDSPAIPSPPLSSTIAPESCISSQAPPPTASPFNLLEISLISAQDLAPISKSMQTYAVAWINPNRKHTTRPDQKGHKNPTWNDKFVFPLDIEEIASENSILTVEIYTVSWFRDVLVGVVKALVSDLTSPLTWARRDQSINTRFVALQVRRPSGNPQGILNMGVTLLENTMRSMPLSMLQNWKYDKQVDHGGDNNRALDDKIHIWRSLSVGSSDFPLKPGSLCNATENGSELCSDIGPSASVVAAELAEKQLLLPPPLPQNSNPATNHIAQHETGSSIVEELTMEEAKAKGYRRERWRKPAAGDGDDLDDDDESELLWEDKNGRRRRRRGSDGGLFSCFVYGIEFTIVCGASKNAPRNKSSSSSSRTKKKNSEASSV